MQRNIRKGVVLDNDVSSCAFKWWTFLASSGLSEKLSLVRWLNENTVERYNAAVAAFRKFKVEKGA